MLPPSHLERLRCPAIRLIGQSAAPRFPGGQVQAYDLFISSLPNFVARAREAGTASHLLPLAFDAGLAAAASPGSRDVSVSFVGGMPGSHSRRTQSLARVARSVDIDIWSPDRPPGWPDSATHARFHGPAWGRAMYDILARSRITVNVHGEHAEGHANNLRLFEATGMGAMLVTDGKRNIRDLFEPGEEVVVFETAEELVELLAYYSSHPDEAAEIARRGQARTLRDHTWDRRMQQFVTLLDAA
jgi:glycosyltransferase involved in cell wall biosynthesis